MRLFGLIGHPLLHSFSAEFFEKKFRKEHLKDCRYRLFDIVTLRDLDRLIKENQELCGLNVIIPYKIEIIPLLDELNDCARETGAVNTLLIGRSQKRNRLSGFNTDVVGFSQAMQPYLHQCRGKALVLGTGGAARAAAMALKKAGIEYHLVSRFPEQKGVMGYHELTEKIMSQHLLIIQATPLGMYSNTTTFPSITYHYLDQSHILFDMVYNPTETLFIQKGRARGCTVINGMEMLKGQAEASWEIWNARS